MRVFLGITGASGAPYAARLLHALADAEFAFAAAGTRFSSVGITLGATYMF